MEVIPSIIVLRMQPFKDTYNSGGMLNVPSPNISRPHETMESTMTRWGRVRPGRRSSDRLRPQRSRDLSSHKHPLSGGAVGMRSAWRTKHLGPGRTRPHPAALGPTRPYSHPMPGRGIGGMFPPPPHLARPTVSIIRYINTWYHLTSHMPFIPVPLSGVGG